MSTRHTYFSSFQENIEPRVEISPPKPASAYPITRFRPVPFALYGQGNARQVKCSPSFTTVSTDSKTSLLGISLNNKVVSWRSEIQHDPRGWQCASRGLIQFARSCLLELHRTFRIPDVTGSPTSPELLTWRSRKWSNRFRRNGSTYAVKLKRRFEVVKFRWRIVQKS